MIKGKNTKPELIVRRFLFKNGFRFRLNVKDLPGKPDIVLPRYKTIVFVNGCFWHGHENCEASKLPDSNVDYWIKKISSNIMRDSQNIQLLNEAGWNVIIIWECELKAKNREKRLELLASEIKQVTFTKAVP